MSALPPKADWRTRSPFQLEMPTRTLASDPGMECHLRSQQPPTFVSDPGLQC